MFALALLLFAGCPQVSPLLPAGEPLPASFKGYELYVWENAGQTWFTLLPGTNRLKTPVEVFSGVRSVVTLDGGFAVTVVGVDAVGGQLARLQRGAPVFVRTVRYPSVTLVTVATPESVARVLRDDAVRLGLSLQTLPATP